MLEESRVGEVAVSVRLDVKIHIFTSIKNIPFTIVRGIRYKIQE
jgi:hypothetical protein